MTGVRDIMLSFRGLGADIAVQHNDIAVDDSLLSSVVISLFTDRLVDPSEQAEYDNDFSGENPRGWWADATLQTTKTGGSDHIGSRLWLLHREKQLSHVVARAQEYAQEALQWLIDEHHVESLTVEAGIAERGHLRIVVCIERLHGRGGWQQSFMYHSETGQFFTEASSFDYRSR